MDGREGLVGEEVPAFRILCKDAVGNVIGHRAEDIALQRQLFLCLGMQRKGVVEPPSRIIDANHRRDCSHADIYCLMVKGMDLGKKEMFLWLGYSNDHRDKKA